MIQPPYTTGTAKVTAGSAIVEGTTTAWTIGLVAGGLFTRLGLAVPILSVESDTRLTLAYAWPGATGTGAYAIDLGRADAASAIVANRRLAEFLSGLAAISPFGAQLTQSETAAQVKALLTIALADVAGLNTAIAGLNTAIAGANTAIAERLLRAGGQMTGPITLPLPNVKSLVVNAVNVLNNGGVYFGNFSGIIAATEHNNGNTGLFLCGSGTVVLLGQTGTTWRAGTTGPGFVSVIYDQGTNGYAVFNIRGGPVQIGIVSIQQRPGA